ncbi:TetR family transcriptional regulator [Eggerthellaceae bacterium zg-893]|nr:TetR family transcriptional regulator [Eggerthellaceae bacterium zg-893]
MAKPNPERCATTRTKIMDSFWKLYKNGGIKAATVSAIIKDASIHRSTFYEYFSDSQAVLNAIEEAQIANAERYVAEAIGKVDRIDPVNVLMGIYGENAEYWSVLLGDNASSSFSQKLKDRIKPFVQEKLGISDDDPMNRYVFEFFVSGVLASVNLWYKRNRKEPAEALAETMRTLYLHGPSAFVPDGSAEA